jgi:hypothetical protein
MISIATSSKDGSCFAIFIFIETGWDLTTRIQG